MLVSQCHSVMEAPSRSIAPHVGSISLTEQEEDPTFGGFLGECRGHVVVSPHVLFVGANTTRAAVRNLYAGRSCSLS